MPATVESRPAIARLGAPVLCGGLVILFVVAAFVNGLSVPFLFDDPLSITENETIRTLSWRALVPPQGKGLTVEGRPVLNYSLALNYAWSGTAVQSYHVVNLAIHAGAALVLFGLVRRTLMRGLGAKVNDGATTGFSLAVALLWAVHPLQTESVTYVVQRTESLMGLFFLLTLYGFARACDPLGSRGWLALALVACALGMATKEVMVAAPVMVLLYDRTFVAGSFRAAWARRWHWHLGFVATWLLLAILAIGAGDRGRTIGAGAGVTPWQFAECQARALVHYLRLSLWPHPLIFDYGEDFVTFTQIAPYGVAVLGLLGLTGFALVRAPALGFLGAWFFVILAPTTSFVGGTRQMLAEHRMYLSLAAVVVLGAWGLRACLGRRVWPIAAALAVALGLTTVQRNRDYRDELTIYSDTVRKRPNNAYARNNLGTALITAGRVPEAIEQFTAAIRLMPRNAHGHSNLAGAFYRLGRYAECLEHAALALKLQPNYPEAHFNLGSAKLRLGDAEAAIECFRRALRYRPGYAEAYCNLGAALLQAGRKEEAIRSYEAALRLKPDYADAHYSLGVVMQQSGELDRAIARYEIALRFRPNYVEAHSNLGLALLHAHRPAEAIAHLERAVQLAPNFADAHFNLALVFVETNRPAEAIVRFETALRLNPSLTAAHFRLANLLARVGRSADAIAHYEAALRAQPDEPELHNNLGSALFQGSDRTADAVAEFETALRLKPDFAEAHCNLGVALAYLKRNAEADAHFTAALRLKPNYTYAREQLAKLRGATGTP